MCSQRLNLWGQVGCVKATHSEPSVRLNAVCRSAAGVPTNTGSVSSLVPPGTASLPVLQFACAQESQ